MFPIQARSFNSLIPSTIGESSAKSFNTKKKSKKPLPLPYPANAFSNFESSTLDAWTFSSKDEKTLNRSARDLRVSGNVDGQLLEASDTDDFVFVSKENADDDAKDISRHSSPVLRLETDTPSPFYKSSKCDKFERILFPTSNSDADINIDLMQLKKISWSGVPQKYRPETWRILSGYAPAKSRKHRVEVVNRKREEYATLVKSYFTSRNSTIHADIHRQIIADVPRMSPMLSIFQQKEVQAIIQRILFVWAIRHPASGYVQGINDLVIPFFVIFLSEYVKQGIPIDTVCVCESLTSQNLFAAEADTFWCFSKLLEPLHNNYIVSQPGIQVAISSMRDLVKRTNSKLYRHLKDQGVHFIQFSFRWFNNLLMRELPLRCCIKLWDALISEGPQTLYRLFLYVCVAFLNSWTNHLMKERDFQGLLLFLQNLPTAHWSDEQMEILLAEAFKLTSLFANAPNHFKK